MAKQTYVRLICDVGEPHEGTHSVTFAVGSDSYEVDLCDKHRQTFDKDMQKWTSAGTKAHSARRKGSMTKASQRATAGGLHTEVRQWAKIKGIEVPARGNLPKAIVEQYKKEVAA